MSLRYTVIIILLLLSVLLLGYGNYRVWSPPSAMTPKKDMGKKGEAKPDSPTPAGAAKEAVPLEGFNVIAEKNVFNPDRQEFSTAAAAAMAKPVTRPQITLHGVVITEDYQSASIVNPGRPLHKGERETRNAKVGDMVGEYKLSKILPDRIVMEAGEDSFEVLLYDPRAPKRRVEIKTATPPAAITSTVGPPVGGAPPPRPPVVVSPPSPPAQPVQIPRPLTPLPVPRVPGQAQGGYQAPPVPDSASSPAAPDPGLWRGRRPTTPGGPPG